MAVHRWVSTSGDFNAAASWSSATAPSGWGVTDTVIFTDLSDTDASSGLSQSAVRVARLIVDSTYHGNIGATGNSLTISPDSFVLNGSPETAVFLAGGSGVIDEVVVDSFNLVDALTLTGKWSNLYLKNRGRVNATAGSAITNLITNGNHTHLYFTADAAVSGMVAKAVFSGGLVSITPSSNQWLLDATGQYIQSGGSLYFEGEWGYVATSPYSYQMSGISSWKGDSDASVLVRPKVAFMDGLADLSAFTGSGLMPTDVIVGPHMSIFEDVNNSIASSISIDLRLLLP